MSFAVPWAGSLLLGTTDEPYEGEPEHVEPTEADVSQVLAEAARRRRGGRRAARGFISRSPALRVLPGVRRRHGAARGARP